MRDFPAAVMAVRAERAGIVAHHLVWFVGRDRATGEPASIGFWSGRENRDFTIRGEARTYFGAGTLLKIDLKAQEAGVQVRQHSVGLSSIAPEVEQALRGYDVRLALCEIHRAEFSPTTTALLAEPMMEVDGEVDGVSIPSPADGGEAEAKVTVLSNAAMLTRPLTRKRSEESLRAWAPGDGFLRYAKVSGTQGDMWGADP